MHQTDHLSEDRHEPAAAMLLGRRILVVEDEALIALMLADDLAEAGAAVIGPAASVGAALKLIEHALGDGGLDAAVLDLRLGRETAVPVAQQLAALGVPFLFATGYGAGDAPLGQGGHRVLRKPFGPDQLLNAVGALTEAGARA